MLTFPLSFPATLPFSTSSTDLVGLSSASKLTSAPQVAQLACLLTLWPGPTFSHCMGRTLDPALRILDVPKMNTVKDMLYDE